MLDRLVDLLGEAPPMTDATGAILPTFCPIDLYRAARPRIVLYDESA
jgi:hypothetical protein